MKTGMKTNLESIAHVFSKAASSHDSREPTYGLCERKIALYRDTTRPAGMGSMLKQLHIQNLILL